MCSVVLFVVCDAVFRFDAMQAMLKTFSCSIFMPSCLY